MQNQSRLMDLIQQCPHVASLSEEEQQALIKQENFLNRIPHPHMSVILNQQHDVPKTCPYISSVSDTSTLTDTSNNQQQELKCPYQSFLNGEQSATAMKASDFKCNKCSAYLIGCMSSKTETLCKYCYQDLMNTNEGQQSNYEADDFKQHLTDSYVEILFERNENERSKNNNSELDEVELKLRRIEFYINLSKQEYALNKNCGPYWMEKARSIAFKDIFIATHAKSELSPKLLILFCIVSGHLSDMLQTTVSNDFSQIAEMLEETISTVNSASSILQNPSINDREELAKVLSVTSIKLGDLFLYKMKNLERAKQIYEQLISSNLTVESVVISHAKMGDLYVLNANHREKALQCYLHALEFLKTNASIQNKNATLYNWISSKIQKMSN
ncbi:hypothetical protein FDP41_012182 [Naegleria fowleri]|uniref:Uncharacterized protein n=1 Tax=Naegleria fowleri TaxID=5763 RepID=A0A6A5C7W3_NAEFO|nr:uncharacterized protein FDP41_012182 [Naegleria fowleri]KAF0981525.1 hypothetical protein FDP41_012182 [Naegleria fowleri]CAG4709409.1 unnamed protein product [Naegleria fowleri]